MKFHDRSVLVRFVTSPVGRFVACAPERPGEDAAGPAPLPRPAWAADREESSAATAGAVPGGPLPGAKLTQSSTTMEVF